jgi:chitodextrinase
MSQTNKTFVALGVLGSLLLLVIIFGSGTFSKFVKGQFAKVLYEETIQNVSVEKYSDNAVVITWETERPTTSQVLYAPVGKKEYQKTEIPKDEVVGKEFGSRTHKVVIENLDPKIEYQFYVSSCDESNMCGVSREGTLSVDKGIIVSPFSPSSDTTPPTQANSVEVVQITTTTARIEWGPATDDTDSQSDIFYEIQSQTACGGVCGITSSGTLHFVVSNLTPGTTYSDFYIFARDLSNNVSAPTPNISFDTDVDRNPPTPPANLVSPAKTATTVSLSWDPSTDDSAVSGYQVYLGGQIYTPTAITGTTYTVTGLTPGTSYQFSVRAIDIASNTSALSSILSVTTNSAGLTVSNVTSSGWSGISRTISWTSSAPATSQVIYDTVSHATGGVYPYATTATTNLVTSHSVVIDNLQSGATYYYKVRSVDSLGNSVYSSEQSFTTPTCANAPDTLYPFPLQMWVWKDNDKIIDPATQAYADFFSFINSHNIQVVYLYLPVSFFGNSTKVANLKTFLNTARDQYCLGVEALDGEASWVAMPGNPYFTSGPTTNAATTWAAQIVSFNNSITGNNAKLIGLQYDVEPYLLSAARGYVDGTGAPLYNPEWSDTDIVAKQKISNAFLDMMQAIRAVVAGSGLILDEAPPRWFDTATGLTDADFIRTPNGTGSITGKSVMKHLLDIVDTMTVQDYVVTGAAIYNDGRNELDYAITLGKKIRLGIETEVGYGATTSFGDVPGITCAAMMAELSDAYSRIISGNRARGFEGFGIEHYKGSNNTPAAYSALCP